MNTVSIERIESGPASQDRTAAAYFGNHETAYIEQELRANFAKAADVGDANAVCSWAPFTTDWNAINRLPLEQRTAEVRAVAKRAQTLTELMVESLDYGDGPSMVEAMHLILAATKSSDTDLALLAGDLVERMGASFALHNC